jgi:hypothetical protein
VTTGDAPSTQALSHALEALARDPARERVSVGDILHAVEDEHALVALILLFALPNTVPVPPGTSALLGTPLLFLTLQLALGLGPWLPRRIKLRSMPRRDFAGLMNRCTPWTARIGRLLRPRCQALAGKSASRWLGGLCMVLSCILVLPIPLGNMLPAAAICIVALGVLQRDGVWVLAGSGIGLAAIALAAEVVHLLTKAGAGLLPLLGG